MKASHEDRPAAIWLAIVRQGLRGWCSERGFWVWVSRAIGGGLVAAWWLGVRSIMDQEAGAIETVGWGLFSFAALMAGAIFLVPSIVPYAASPFFAFIDSIYLGGSAVERPRLDYAVADRRWRERRWEDAADEFDRIAYWHRKEVRAYRDGIRASRLAGNEAMADRFYRRGVLNCPSASAELRRARRAMLTDIPIQTPPPAPNGK